MVLEDVVMTLRVDGGDSGVVNNTTDPAVLDARSSRTSWFSAYK